MLSKNGEEGEPEPEAGVERKEDHGCAAVACPGGPLRHAPLGACAGAAAASEMGVVCTMGEGGMWSSMKTCCTQVRERRVDRAVADGAFVQLRVGTDS